MRKQNLWNKAMCFFLSFVMVMAGVQTTALARVLHEEQVIDVIDENNDDDYDFERNDVLEMARVRGLLRGTIPVSDARSKYNQLLEGSYNSNEIKDLFQALFGEYDEDEIKDNYTEIFDISPHEMDEAILEILTGEEYTGERGVYEEESIWEEEKEDFWRENERDTLDEDFQIADYLGEDVVFEPLSEVAVRTPFGIAPMAANFVNIGLISKTSDSITFRVVFLEDGKSRNRVTINDAYANDYGVARFRVIENYGVSGNYTIYNLAAESDYEITMRYNDLNGGTGERVLNVTTASGSPNYITSSGSNLTYMLESRERNKFENFSSFASNMDDVYDVIYGLVGGAKPYNGAKMQVESTRGMDSQVRGGSGQPIRWSNRYILGQISKMNQHGDFSATVIHEISHNFDSSHWKFDSEALAHFKVAYAIERLNGSVAEYGNVYDGSEFRTVWLKSDATKTTGDANYDETIARGIYSSIGMAYILANIGNEIGWEAFEDTFRYFHQIRSADIPPTKLGKLNLFLSKLSDFSGRNVFNLLTSQEKSVLSAEYGGSIQYMSLETPDIPNVIRGVRYVGGVMTPVRTSSDLNATLEIVELSVDPADDKFYYSIRINTSGNSWGSTTGTRSVYSCASYLHTDGSVLAATMNDSSNWKVHSLTIERSADKYALLPANQESLAGKPVIKIAIERKATGDVYYFEMEISQALFEEISGVAFSTASATRKAEMNANVFWYLNMETDSVPSGQFTLAQAQNGFRYNAAQVSQRVGRTTVDATFEHFKSLSASNLPATPLGRLNAFLAQLQQNSGQDVIGMFSVPAKSYYEGLFGGAIGSIYFTEQEIYSIAQYHISNIESTNYVIREEMLPLVDETGQIFAYAVPFEDSRGRHMGHINVGALKDGLSFYLIDPYQENFYNIQDAIDSGWVVLYAVPFAYYACDIRDLTTRTQSSSAPQSVRQNETYVNEEQYQANMLMLEEIAAQKEKTAAVMFRASIPHTVAGLERDLYSGAYVKVTNIEMQNGKKVEVTRYGGNQNWWNRKDEAGATPSRTGKTGNVLADQGCGMAAITDLLLYHVYKDYGTYKNLLNYTDRTKEEILFSGVNHYYEAFDKTFDYDSSQKQLTSDEYVEMMDFYTYMLGTLMYTEGMSFLEMDVAMERLKAYTEYKYNKYVPVSPDCESVEAFFVEQLNNNNPIIMLNWEITDILDIQTQYLLNDSKQARRVGLYSTQEFSKHWMVITKYFKNNNTGQASVAIATWGYRLSVNAELLKHHNKQIGDVYYSDFRVYEIEPK